jgi:hypothetical protein
LSELKDSLHENEKILLTLKEKYGSIIDVDAEKKEVETSLLALKQDYSEKRELLDRLIEKVDFYSDDLYASDFGIYELPVDLVSSGEYSVKLADCKIRIKEWISSWKKKYEQNAWTSFDDFEWFYLPREFTDYRKEGFFTKEIHMVNTIRNNQIFFLHYFSYMFDDIIKKTTLANYQNQKKKD